jgi:thioredoxin reductase (NADPH)
MALMGRAYSQAQKFGVEMAIPDEVTGLETDGGPSASGYVLRLFNDERVRARSVVIATGARYRRLDIADLDRFEGSNVHYWASPLEAKLCAGQEVALVGAGNSAGQSVVYLASRVDKLWLLVRGRDPAASMSRYLVDRIKSLPNVEVVTQAQVVGLEGGDAMLEAIRWQVGSSGKEIRRPIRHLFSFIGATPNTDWLAGSGIALDAKGFVRTAGDIAGDHRPLETALKGVFAVGDVRSGSVKRVAAAVGEGAQVVATLHGVLSETPSKPVRAHPGRS